MTTFKGKSRVSCIIRRHMKLESVSYITTFKGNSQIEDDTCSWRVSPI